MDKKLQDNLSEATNVCCENIKNGIGDPEQNMKAAAEGARTINELEKASDEKEHKFLNRFLSFLGGIFTVLIPAVVIELLQEKSNKTAREESYFFEANGYQPTTYAGKSAVRKSLEKKDISVLTKAKGK